MTKGERRTLFSHQQTCSGKKPYLTEQAAQDGLKWSIGIQKKQMGKKGFRAKSKHKVLNIYQCMACGYFHLGHTEVPKTFDTEIVPPLTC